MTTPIHPRPEPDLDTFETELLALLRTEVSARAAAAPEPGRTAASVGRAPSHHRARFVALTGSVAAAVATVLAVPLTSTPAYALSVDGAEITLSINRLEDSAGLTRALAAHGIRAQVDYLPMGTLCAPGRYVEVLNNGVMRYSVGTVEPAVTVTLDTGRWQPEWTLVLAHSVIDRGAAGSVGVAAGAVAPCRPG